MVDTAKPMRADARRNYERLMDQARAAFAERGTEASLEDIAGAAGVGIGTLYRHFPTRQDLLEALLREQFDALAATGRDLLDDVSAGAALVTWVSAFVAMTSTYRGLTAALTATLRDESTTLHAACVSMRAVATALLERAQQAGAVRADVSASDFLILISGVAWAYEHVVEESPRRLLDLVFEGLVER
ncbi:TetR/AcrR family transcriptional regulator [Actinokineospora sp. NBRC 105648]|uniref:TetR/AcrR family transcriptional regulator n=1 Tax=Actinokineospora sp. NBRC 105648 TaxID=3032206 RepID=UPI0024A2974D|nr:TetR/AcrR family transcriptional regulator [Actinokineospora sp. NBRC 105648]GLZ39152.1 TetR family transcriptional regulator [Actinokineospora sp. NBRC 105648]